ncbi:inositol monophosphatase family protein [Sporobolomyces salmoneus]|uniref:inositol monophosphatase family protein n=1 Tax=Sporobolomyces salmoneus TaxID=183962 RepID=UPI00316FCABF
MAHLDLSTLHAFAAKLAIEAGSYLRDQALQRTQGGRTFDESISIKENAADLVTHADMHAEQLISDAIRKEYPDHKIIGEESYSAGQEKRFLLDDDPTWIIDPLDGTVNFVHLFPTCCVSVGFCVNKIPVVGAVFAPMLGGLHVTNASGTLYSAAQGHGSWSTPISFPFDPSVLSPPSTPPATNYKLPQPFHHSVPLPYLPPQPIPSDAPKGCLFLAEWGKARSDSPTSNLTKKVNTLWNFAAEVGGREGKGGMVHGLRSLGSAALDMVYVATGAIDIFWEGGCWEWDVCAGTIIVNEAGGIVVPSQTPASILSDPSSPIPPADLGSRLYLAIRPAGDSEDGEKARDAQERLVREVWKRVEKLDYVRPQ